MYLQGGVVDSEGLANGVEVVIDDKIGGAADTTLNGNGSCNRATIRIHHHSVATTSTLHNQRSTGVLDVNGVVTATRDKRGGSLGDAVTPAKVADGSISDSNDVPTAPAFYGQCRQVILRS